jgi:hypothetical protein
MRTILDPGPAPTNETSRDTYTLQLKSLPTGGNEC